MPYKSEAQRRYFHWAAKHGKGNITPEMASEWEAHTPKDEKLPEKVSMLHLLNRVFNRGGVLDRQELRDGRGAVEEIERLKRLPRRTGDLIPGHDTLPGHVEKKATMAALFNELEKIAWFGTYYHGTSPEAESKILTEGLDATRGGKEGWSSVAGLAANPTRDAGKVYLTPSKTIAKAYGTLGSVRENLKQHLALHPGAQPISAGHALLNTARDFVGKQPLQVQGTGLKLRPGLGLLVPGLETVHKGSIPASVISKTQPSRLGKLLSKGLSKL